MWAGEHSPISMERKQPTAIANRSAAVEKRKKGKVKGKVKVTKGKSKSDCYFKSKKPVNETKQCSLDWSAKIAH